MSRQREVPQFINIEDKIAFQLTAKQLGWIGLGCFFAFLAWMFLEKTYFVITSVFIAIFILAILFVRPYGQTLPVFIGNAISFLFKPKVYIWRKGYQNISNEDQIQIKPKKKTLEKSKKINPQEIQKAIKNLDIYE